jgi:hypothetical protein
MVDTVDTSTVDVLGLVVDVSGRRAKAISS